MHEKAYKNNKNVNASNDSRFLWVMLRKMAMNEPPLNSRLRSLRPCLEYFILTSVTFASQAAAAQDSKPHE